MLDNRRWPLAVCSILAMCCLTLWGQTLCQHPNHSYGGRDEIKYVLSARMIGNPDLVPPTIPQYPPGWPAILALTFRLGGGLPAAHLVNLGLVCVGIALIAAYGSTNFGTVLGCAVATLLAMHRTTISIGDKLLSEPLFLACLTTTLLFVQRSIGRCPSVRNCFCAGFLIALCRVVRTAGISIWLGLVVYLLTAPMLPWRKRIACIAAISIAPVVLELLLAAYYPHSCLVGGYAQQLRETRDVSPNATTSASGFLRPVLAKLRRHTRELADSMIPIPQELWKPRPVFGLTGLLIAGAGVLGLIRAIWTRQDPVACIGICYLLLIACWYYHAVRFFWPVVPLLWLYATRGFPQWHRRAPPLAAAVKLQPHPYVLSLLALASWACVIAQPPLGREHAQRELDAFRRCLSWIDQHDASPQRSVASISCYQVYLLRPKWRITALQYNNDCARQLAEIHRRHITWFVEYRYKAEEFFADLLQQGVLRETVSYADVTVYRASPASINKPESATPIERST